MPAMTRRQRIQIKIEHGAEFAAGLQQTNQTRWGNAEHQKGKEEWCRICDCFKKKRSKKMANVRRRKHKDVRI
jgi:hypothetical protein